ASSTAFAIVKWTGAAYLVFVGLRLLRSRGTSLVVQADAAAPRGRLVAQAFVTQMGNPKAMIFFGALLPQFVDPKGDIALQFAVFGLVEVAIEDPILLMYGFLADRGRKLAGGKRALLWFERTAGGLLIAAGARLALLARM
ncbi:MAG TPA: LysE family transporter, partial [Vicinamibacteria bacterium]